jgi:hypothetical protein
MSVIATSATSVLGADTRHLYVGSGPVGDATNGILTLTPVTAGGVTASDVIVKNVDNQTLTHVVLTFMAPTGLTLSGVFGTSAALCQPGATAPLVCDFGNLAKNQTRTFTVLYTAGSAGAATVSAQVTFNETRPNSGGNTHIDPIGGAVTVDAATCDHVATFLAPSSSPKNVGTDAGCSLSLTNPQTTSVQIPGSVVSAVTVGESSTVLCDTGLDCFGQASVADVAINGTYPVIWTIQWQVVSNFNIQKFGILHFPDGATVPDLTLTAKKNMCKNATQLGCIESVNLVGTTLTAVVRTAGNGVMKGFH